jgi:cytochrome c oxidase cbb3-type subunit III
MNCYNDDNQTHLATGLRSKAGLYLLRKKKIFLLSVFLLFSFFSGWAQENTGAVKPFWDDPINHPLMPLYFISVLIFVVLVLVLVVAVIALRVLNLYADKAARDKATKLGVSYVPAPGWWTKAWQKANAMVPLTEESGIELDHNYDGIRELDNHLPPWWKGLFYGTIIFAVVYLALFHVFNTLPLSGQEYENELAQAEEHSRIMKALTPPEVFDESGLIFSPDAVKIGRGRTVFMSNNCGSCHRVDGGGTIGPNLTDVFWLHGGDIKDVFRTVKNGVVEKAMPAWGKVMSNKDVRDVSFFVLSLQGTNPLNAKAPQGTLYKPQPEIKSQDTVKIQASIGK